jgi:predicted amidohydrolase YtcJ
MRTLLRDVEVEGDRVEVELVDGEVAQVGPALELATAPDEVVEGDGGALLPGLHDHHLHLFALAAERASVRCGPPWVRSPGALADALHKACQRTEARAWVRGTGYHESVAGDLDRHGIDAIVGDRAVRIQHRSGALWMLSSRALQLLGDRIPETSDVERDADGRPNGRLWRLDAVMKGTFSGHAPSLTDVDAELAACGITGVTDATPDLDEDTTRLLENAALDADLRADVLLLGASRPLKPARFELGPVKLLLHDHDLPTLDELVDRILAARSEGRPVAVHVVTRLSLVLTLAALDVVGVVPGDRLEHAAVVPPELRPELARRGLVVVTQPGFLRTRGDAYLADVDPDDLACLYPYAGLLAAGVQVAGSSDAPYGELDPWQVMADAVARITEQGHVLGPEERVSPHTVLLSYLSSPTSPGGPPRRVVPGAAANLCLLGVPHADAMRAPRRTLVRRTFYAPKKED